MRVGGRGHPSGSEDQTHVSDVEVRLTQVYKAFGNDAAGRRVAQYVEARDSGLIIAVDHIDLEVEDGEFFSLLGPSGCGKTTTLRMIGGFEQPTSGMIELAGQDVTWLPPYKRNVNTVFQNYALFPHLSIFDNVAFGLRRKHLKEAEVKARVTEMLELVELPGYERRKPSQLSGGQAQRVALARALVNKPSVLLLDEPLGALDLKLRKQMQVELKRIQQEVGITFIYVTHDQEEAMTMSNRIAVMNRGKYEQLGAPETLYERPATAFVAGFLGVSNLLPASMGERDGDYRFATLAHGAVVRIPSSLVDGERAIRIGVRPEKIRLHADPSTIPDQMNRLEGQVIDASYLGASTSYIVRSPDGERLTVFEQNIGRTAHGSLHQPGQQVHLSWSPDHTFAVSGTAAGSAGSPEAT
jgi:spermidine/putrescine transport system ATP-binding protein